MLTMGKKGALIATEDGVEFMVSTPHMFNGLSNNPEPSEILERVAALNEAINNSASIKILPGNEVHVSHEIAEQAKTNRVTKINSRNYMLVEFPQLTVPVGPIAREDDLPRGAERRRSRDEERKQPHDPCAFHQILPFLVCG